MLTPIVRNNDALCTFVSGLGLPLSRPQLRHVLNVADALLVTVANKTLSALCRQLLQTTDVSNVADTFRIGPWTAEMLLSPLRHWSVARALEYVRRALRKEAFLLVSLDDSLIIKDPATTHLEGVTWHYDHSAKCRRRAPMQNSFAYLDCHLSAPGWECTFSLTPYLREKTVRQLNRQRPHEKRLHFVSLPRLARQQLAQLCLLIPRGVPVYVQCDIWFASKKLIKYVCRQGWHVICRIKKNRSLNGQPVTACFASQKHQRYEHVTICAADGAKTNYLVRSLVGRLAGLPFDVRVWESRRHYRDRCPVYFVSTDLALSAQEGLKHYAKRWQDEVDHWYLKERVGLGDFRLHSYEAICNYLAVVQLAWAYLQERVGQATGQGVIPAAIIQQHQDEHAETWLRHFGQAVLAAGSVESVLQQYLHPVTAT
jgi:hypothetical protein